MLATPSTGHETTHLSSRNAKT
eukprot:COSAG02_NODE_67123_length_253_cov_1.668831_1_plen_21_part_10